MSADHFDFRVPQSPTKGGLPLPPPPPEPDYDWIKILTMPSGTQGQPTDDLLLLDVQPLNTSDPDRGTTPADIIIWDIDGDGEGFDTTGTMGDLFG